MNVPPKKPLFGNRILKVCYWNAESRVLDADRMGLEQHLKRLGEINLVNVATLDSPEVTGADLLLVAAQTIPSDKFSNWLSGLQKRIRTHGQVWTPALILADVPNDVLSEIWPEVTKENWYFDILAPSHMASLPIRVANLLRIHDHLHELKRYGAALDDINAKVRQLESRLPNTETQNGKK